MSALARSCGEMIERQRQRCKRLSALVANHEVMRPGDGSDLRERQIELTADCRDPIAQRGMRGEAQLIVVAAREQALQRQIAFVARKLFAHRARSWNRHERDIGSNVGGFKNMREIAGKAVRDIDCG